MEYIKAAVLIYAVVINLIAVFITIYDKKISKKRGRKRRVPESTLLLFAALSGCIAMYITMRMIHHKTKHPKFMIGIPVIFIAELLCAAGIMKLLNIF